ncbi:MAG TPA: AmmeMemoRadiSam system protein B [Burkholderiales bacterium]|nr:AmmeMemoRadiSam system protein B [Burkholderiales bacterium]
MASVRPAAIAGTFYPGNRDELARGVNAMLAAAKPVASPPTPATPKAIIAPHAGYIYSGPIAASIYALIAPMRTRIKRVVLLGPAHRVAFQGIALPGVDAFATPLGTVSIDTAAVKQLMALPYVGTSKEAHRLEHSLEVQLPFLQTVLEEFTLVPMAIGRANAQQVAAALELLWGGDETLIVVSSDMSHYLPYTDAQATDSATAQAILDLRTDINHHQACGATPVTGLNLIAQKRNLKPQLIDLRNSGDTAGDKARVVGYASFAFYEPAHPTH